MEAVDELINSEDEGAGGASLAATAAGTSEPIADVAVSIDEPIMEEVGNNKDLCKQMKQTTVVSSILGGLRHLLMAPISKLRAIFASLKLFIQKVFSSL